ncbi:MAG: hypothetical protein N4A63_04015 [Vallitalea sp.]|jgi:hypothetical protein|nr:hypothetical protein [Vallitalea sp.]
MKKILKNLGAITMAFAMVLMLTLPSNASTSVHDARLYKDGEFDAININDNLSMGDGAIGDAIVTSNGSNYTITIDIAEDFYAHGVQGNVTEFTCSDPNVTTSLYDTDGNGKNDTLIMITDSLTYPELFNVNVTIDVWIMPIAASGDLVIF